MFEQDEIEYLQSVLLPTQTSASLLPEEDILLLDNFFEDILQSNSPHIDQNLIISLYYELRTNNFSSALQIAEERPECIEQIYQGIHFTKLLKFFLFLLRHNLLFIAEQIWLENIYFIDFFTAKDVIISHFEVVLQAGSQLILEKMWDIGKDVISQFYQADFDKSIALFETAINLSIKPIIIELWDNNRFIKEKAKINLQKLHVVLKQSLLLNIPKIVQDIWHINEMIDYYSGKQLYTKKQRQVNTIFKESDRINLLDTMDVFKLAIANEYSNIYTDISQHNRVFMEYFSGINTSLLTIDLQGHVTKEDIDVNTEDLIANARLVMEHNAMFVMIKMLESNLFIKNYFIGIPQNVIKTSPTGETNTYILQISFLELVTSFKKFLSAGLKDICSKILNINPCILEYYSGIQIETSIPAANKFFIIPKVSFQETIDVFELAVLNSFNNFSTKIWQNCRILHDYYAGNPIEIIVSNKNNVTEKKILQLKVVNLIRLFNKLVANQHHDIARAIWEKNSKFSELYCGHPVNLNDGLTGKPDYIQCTPHELIKNFKHVLSNQCTHTIGVMIKSEPLDKAIRELNARALNALTTKVLNSCQEGKIDYAVDFMVRYATIKTIDDIYNQKILIVNPSDIISHQLTILKQAKEILESKLQVDTTSLISQNNFFESHHKKRKYDVDLSNSDDNAKYQKLG